MYRRILVALEGKDTDEAVLTHIQTLGAEMRAEITLLRIITVADDGGTGLGRQFQLEVGSSGWRRKNQAETYLPRLKRRLQHRGLHVETALVIGSRSEADEIVSYAAKNGYGLIAMASDPRPWYKRWVGGSPAGGVLRSATVPTLFISDGTRKAPVARVAPKANRMMALFGTPNL